MAAFNPGEYDEFEVTRVKADRSDVEASGGNYSYAVAWEEMNAARRSTMEDVHRIVPKLKGSPEYSYFGVYDGHGGRQIVDYLDTRLEDNISKELREMDDASILERMRRAFLITDMESRQEDITSSGATVVSALLVTKEGQEQNTKKRVLYVANAGDSRAVLLYKMKDGSKVPETKASAQQQIDAVRAEEEKSHMNHAADDSSDSAESDELPPDCGFIAERLSFDHRVDDDGEQDRIKKAGGFFTRNRVLGILAVTRSFGDHGMKAFVCAEPHLVEIDLSERDEVPLLILACDGVWDVLTDQEAGNIVMDEYNRIGGPYEDAAQLLVSRAIERGSADNVSAIVVFL